MNTRIQNGKQYVLCAWRRKYVRLTPEEYVRQKVLHILESNFGYPRGLIGVEISIELSGLKKRCDAIIYTPKMQPIMLIEFKAEKVSLTQGVFDQAAIYNSYLHVPFLMLSNGCNTILAEVKEKEYNFLSQIPTYENLINICK